MHHLRLTPKRLLALSSLLVSGAALWLPLRGAAQDGMTAPSAAAPMSDSGVDSGNVGSDTNGADSAISPTGEAAPDPAVGVDNTGRDDATSTRTGRTRRKPFNPPVNPLVIKPNQDTTDTSLPLPGPVAPRDPEDYTRLNNQIGGANRQNNAPLPLFGYDFFQPARQIIIARRLALLPRRVRPTRPTNSRRRPLRPGVNGTNQGNGANGSNNTQAGQSSARPQIDPITGDVIPPDQTSPDQTDQTAPDQMSPDQTSGDQATQEQQARQRAAIQQTYGDQTAAGGADTTGYGTTDNGTTGYGTTDNGTSGYGTTDNGGQDTNFDGSSGGTGSDQYGQYGPNRTRRTGIDPRTGVSYQNNNGFQGDTQTPNGDIQFPGDDALLQSGAANTVTGEIADPVSTLYRNVLTSLPTNYQLQPGDKLTVRYSALTLTPVEFQATVDIQGGIAVPGVGRISVAGRTASQAEDTLRLRLERLYRNVDVSINLRELRTIQVTVSGSAFAPGTYNIPATATAFNVLNAAGGPTANGSLRDIRILRNGRLAGTLDIYPLIGATSGNPNNRHGDINLQSGDNIYIPARLSRIAVRGEVRQQAIFELTPAETLRDALNYSGGVKPSGVDQTVHIDTVLRGTNRVLRDVDLRNKAQAAAVPLYDGDTVDVASVRAILTNRVTVQGAVDQPGAYALVPGMRVSDLIERARGPLYNAYLDRADLTRLNPDNTTTLFSIDIARILDTGDTAQNKQLAREDVLQIYTRQEVSYLGRRTVMVRGAVQRPGSYTESDNMRVSDLLLKTGGPLPDAYLNRAVLLHQHGDGTFAYDYVNLHEILAGDPTADMAIHDNDVLAVYRIGEAHFTPDHTVKVVGDVVAPGLYARGEDMRLSDLLKLAGAFKPGGGTQVTVAHARRSIDAGATQVAPITVALGGPPGTAVGTDLVLQDGDVVAVQGDGGLRDHPSVVTVTGAVNQPGPIFVTGNMRLSDAVKKAGGLRPEAFAPGAEFTRTGDALATSGQLTLATLINEMSNLLNLSQYQRERAKANLELIEAANGAASGSSSGLGIPGLSGGSTPPPPASNTGDLFRNLAQTNPVSPSRILTPSQLQPNGSVAVRLAEALRRPGGPEDFLLKDGDTLVVPETPTTVQVVGAVFNARGVLYKRGESIDYYIQRTGDFTPDAAKDRIEVIHAGGGLIPAGKAGALQPGDLILVPTKVLAEQVSRSGNNFTNFFQGLIGSAFSLKVLTSVFGL